MHNTHHAPTTIAFIGAGNMSRAIIGGLISTGIKPQQIIAANPTTAKLDALANDFGVQTSQDNLFAVSQADMIILAVKPLMVATVCQQLAESAIDLQGKLFISLAVGATCQRIRDLLQQDVSVVRCMPNTPALYQQGVCGLFSDNASEPQKQQAQQLLAAIGTVIWVDQESLIDAITAVSGSGPAYFFLLMEAMVAKACALGFDPDTARTIVMQTATGAATMVQNSELSIAQLRQNVTSKGGTTAAALAIYEQQGLPNMVDEAMQAAFERAQALTKLC